MGARALARKIKNSRNYEEAKSRMSAFYKEIGEDDYAVKTMKNTVSFIRTRPQTPILYAYKAKNVFCFPVTIVGY